VSDFPLTPGEAIVLATFLEGHAKLPHLVALVGRLRTWARTEPQTETDPIPSENAPQRSQSTLNPDQVNLALTKEV
jgi:hypothetical protein